MKKILEYKLLDFADYTLSVYNVLSVIIFLIFITILLMVIKKLIYRSSRLEPSKKFSVNKLSRYIIAIFTILISLHLVGFDISVLLAGSAALLVGLGFGLQNLFSDFISGVILLLDGTLKVNDVIEVNGMMYKVQDINFRTTTVIGRDENYVILPNTELTHNRVVNWTHDSVSSRFKISIGIDYSSDVNLFMKTIKEVAQKHEKVLKSPEPFVRFEDYGDSSLNFALYFYSEEIFRIENIKSALRVEIYNSLKENGINIPFPQRVVHLKNE